MSAGAGFFSSLVSLATSAFSNAINQHYTRETREEQNAFNSWEAQKARMWNQQMDNTKYQRTVADMQAAGVNPALAMQGGVSTQASSNAQAQGANVAVPQLDLSQVAQMFMQAKQLKIQEKLADSQSNKNNAEAGKIKEETSWIS